MKALFDWLIGFIGSDLVNADSVKTQLEASMEGVFSADMRAIYDVFSQIGVYLLLLYFCMDLLDKLSSENFSIDVLILNFIKLIAGYALILNGFDIIHGLSGLADMASEAIIENGIPTENVMDPIESINEGSLKDIILIILKIASSLIGIGHNIIDLLVASLISKIVITLVCCQRAIRIAIRMFAAPLVLADVIGHGMNNNAMHYLRKLLALFMQGPIMIILMVLSSNSILEVMPFFGNILTSVVCAKLLFDSKSISEDLIL